MEYVREFVRSSRNSYIILIHHFPISLCWRIMDGLIKSEECYFFLCVRVPPFSNYPGAPGGQPPCCYGTPRNREREPPVLPASIVYYVVSVFFIWPHI